MVQEGGKTTSITDYRNAVTEELRIYILSSLHRNAVSELILSNLLGGNFHEIRSTRVLPPKTLEL